MSFNLRNSRDYRSRRGSPLQPNHHRISIRTRSRFDNANKSYKSFSLSRTEIPLSRIFFTFEFDFETERNEKAFCLFLLIPETTWKKSVLNKKRKKWFRSGKKLGWWRRMKKGIKLNLCRFFSCSQLNFLLEIYQLVKIDFYCAKQSARDSTPTLWR